MTRMMRHTHASGVRLFHLAAAFALALIWVSAAAHPQVAINSVLRPSPALLLPYYELEPLSEVGDVEATLIAIRNASNDELTISLRFHSPASVPGEADLVALRTLAGRQTLTLNLRDVEGLVEAGLTEGYAVIRVVDGNGEPVVDAPLLSGDVIRVDPASDLATGSALVPIFPGTLSASLCSRWSTRVLQGGGFDADTRLTFLVDAMPKSNGNGKRYSVASGSEKTDDPLALSAEARPWRPKATVPIVTGVVHGEGGEVLQELELFTDRFAFEVDAADLGLATEFSSVEWTFAEGAFGYVGITTLADGRFAVDLPGTCLDQVSALSPELLAPLVARAASLVPDAVLFPNRLLETLTFLLDFDPQRNAFFGTITIDDLDVEIELELRDAFGNPLTEPDDPDIARIRLIATFVASDFDLVIDLEQAELATGLFSNGVGRFTTDQGTVLELTLEELVVPEDGDYPLGGAVTFLSTDLGLEFRLEFDGTRLAKTTYTFRGSPGTFTVDLETGEVAP